MLTADRFIRSGKVRDLYELDDERLLLVASDRISAFDVVLPTPIPDKGRVLTGLSRYWFDGTRARRPEPGARHGSGETCPPRRRGSIAPSSGAGCWSVAARPCSRSRSSSAATCPDPAGGSTGTPARCAAYRCRRASARATGCPSRSSRPRRRPELGEHDINIDFESTVQLLADWPPNGDDWLGDDAARALAEQVRDVAIASYERGRRAAPKAGIILADTKFEMGLVDGELILVDEVLTPDSSRFWDAATYAPGGPQASFDKQFVRDWLEGQPWDKTAPGPELPDDVVAGTRARYVEAFERITGAGFQRYLDDDVIAPAEATQ